jgi:OCT family organic cation transporter-like MFS transporter 15
MAGIAFNVSEGFIYFNLTLYYRFLSKSWRLPVVVSTLLSLISCICTFLYIPESPKWLYS